MNCPDAKTWDLLSMNLLDKEEAESLRQHSQECERCAAAWQEASRQHAELLETFGAFDRNHDQRREQLMAMLPESVPVSQQEPDTVPWRRWFGEGGVAMSLRRHKTGWAAAASLAAACVLIVFFLMPGEKIAFADVLDKMRQAKTMVCDFITTVSVEEGELPESLAKSPRRGTISIYAGGDRRAELLEYEPSESGKASRLLFLVDKAYLWEGDQVRVITSGAVSQHRATEDWLSRLLEFRDTPDRKLGEETINGRRAVGFEIAGWKLGVGTRPAKGSPTPADSDSRLRVWVDVEQDLPIRLEIDQNMVVWPDVKATIHQRWENIKWNVPLDASKFRPPSEEEIAQAEIIQVPAVDEVAFVDGMRAWLEWKEKAQAGVEIMKKMAQERDEELPAEMSALFERAGLDAGYPERLDMTWLSGIFAARATLANLADMLPRVKPLPEDLDEEERAKLQRDRGKEGAMAAAKVASDAMLKATSVAAFYHGLANEQRDPEYFGATVEPGDSEAILLRWKLDDGRYRVIYGDLQAETVDAAD